MNGQIPFGQMGGQIPMLGQGQPQMTQEQAVKVAIAEKLAQLSMQIYVRAASDVIQQDEVELDELRRLAADSHLAAKCYFEGLGLARFDDQDSPQPR